jgi:hypothetical protein
MSEPIKTILPTDEQINNDSSPISKIRFGENQAFDIITEQKYNEFYTSDIVIVKSNNGDIPYEVDPSALPDLPVQQPVQQPDNTSDCKCECNCPRYIIRQQGGICGCCACDQECDQEDKDFWTTLKYDARNTKIKKTLNEDFCTYSNRVDIDKSKDLVNNNKDLMRRAFRKRIQIANTAWNIHSKINVSIASAWIAAQELDP